MMRNTKLSELARRKGKLLSPWVDQLGDVLTPTSWSIDRLPEYLWLALILDNYCRIDGFNHCISIIKKIQAIDQNFDSAKLSYILSKDDKIDPISLYAQYLDKNDERVEMAFDKIFEEIING